MHAPFTALPKPALGALRVQQARYAGKVDQNSKGAALGLLQQQLQSSLEQKGPDSAADTVSTVIGAFAQGAVEHEVAKQERAAAARERQQQQAQLEQQARAERQRQQAAYQLEQLKASQREQVRQMYIADAKQKQLEAERAAAADKEKLEREGEAIRNQRFAQYESDRARNNALSVENERRRAADALQQKREADQRARAEQVALAQQQKRDAEERRKKDARELMAYEDARDRKAAEAINARVRATTAEANSSNAARVTSRDLGNGSCPELIAFNNTKTAHLLITAAYRLTGLDHDGARASFDWEAETDVSPQWSRSMHEVSGGTVDCAKPWTLTFTNVRWREWH